MTLKIVRLLFGCVLVLLPACFSPYLLPSAYLAVSGIVTNGEVTAKQEAILMPGHDRSRHVLEVTYRY